MISLQIISASPVHILERTDTLNNTIFAEITLSRSVCPDCNASVYSLVSHGNENGLEAKKLWEVTFLTVSSVSCLQETRTVSLIDWFSHIV